MSYAAISPVMSRIQSIQTRFDVPSTLQVGNGNASSGNADFASQLSAAFADSSLTMGTSTGTGATTLQDAPSAYNPTAATGGAAMITTGSSLPSSYGVLTSELGLYGAGATTATAALSTLDWATGGDAAGRQYAAEFTAAGERYGVPPALLSAVGYVESRYDPGAVSSAGAIGMMQIMPEVASSLGVDPTDPTQAIDGAARLLRSHYDRFGSWDLALAAYNAGGGAVSRAGNAIPSPRVAEYVRRVNERMMTA